MFVAKFWHENKGPWTEFPVKEAGAAHDHELNPGKFDLLIDAVEAAHHYFENGANTLYPVCIFKDDEPALIVLGNIGFSGNLFVHVPRYRHDDAWVLNQIAPLMVVV